VALHLEVAEQGAISQKDDLWHRVLTQRTADKVGRITQLTGSIYDLNLSGTRDFSIFLFVAYIVLICLN
jgi:hypothetical protein